MSVTLLRADARSLPIADATVDLIVTSPPYFGLRSYQDGGKHYTGQVGDEATPAEFVDALIECTREMVRVLKPSGSIWVNLGDKYVSDNRGSAADVKRGEAKWAPAGQAGYPGEGVMPRKSLMGIPWRYAIRCIDDLGLILRAEVIWSKPNGLPESVTDRVRRSHETWFHLTKEPRYYSSVDHIREDHAPVSIARSGRNRNAPDLSQTGVGGPNTLNPEQACNPLGKLPGSVWTIPTEPLRVPDDLGVDHFAAFPTEFPRRIIQGWSPRGVCVECGAGRRPVTKSLRTHSEAKGAARREASNAIGGGFISTLSDERNQPSAVITGEACDCPEPTAPTTPGVVLDPFGGTGTTALCADVLGRHGISVDMSADYLRIAHWRTTDPKQRAKAARTEHKPPVEVPDGQATFDLDGMGA